MARRAPGSPRTSGQLPPSGPRADVDSGPSSRPSCGPSRRPPPTRTRLRASGSRSCWGEGPSRRTTRRRIIRRLGVCSFAHQDWAFEGAMRKNAPSPLGIGFRSHVHPRMPLRSHRPGRLRSAAPAGGALSAARVRAYVAAHQSSSCLSKKKRQAPEPRSDPPRIRGSTYRPDKAPAACEVIPTTGAGKPTTAGAPRAARGVVAPPFLRTGSDGGPTPGGPGAPRVRLGDAP